MKAVVFKKIDGIYKIPMYVRFHAGRRKYFFEYEGKLFDREIITNDKEVRQISLLTAALNIKDKRERLSYVYDKACDLLDEDFFGKNLCEFRNGKCINDRKYNKLGGGCCCDSAHHEYMCPHLSKQGCTIRCLACKLHVCNTLKKKGYRYHIDDIYVLKYLLNEKQKIMIHNDFFMTKEEVLKDVIRNSIILWSFTNKKRFVKYNLNKKSKGKI